MWNPRDELKRKIPLALVVCLLLAVPVLVQASSNHDLFWHVIAGGGGRMVSTGHTLLGTAGQSATGSMTVSGGHTLCSGFWYSGTVQYHIYLPLVLRRQ